MADFVPYTTSSSVSPGSGARRCAPGNLWLILLVAALSGCRWSGTVAPWPHDLAEPRRARHEAAATTFEQSRAGAEYREAEQQWEEGDAAGCIQRLERLLERNPDYWEARVLLAEVLLTQDQPERARQWLLPAIRDHSDHPRLHYTMALALEKLGHAEEANAFYRRAMAALPGGQSTHGAGTAPQATWARSPRSPKRLLGGLLKGRTLRRVAAGLRQPGVLGRERVHGLPSASSHAQACQMASSARDDSTTGRGPLGQGSEGSSVQQCAASGAPPGARSSRSTGPEDPGRAPVGGHGQSGIRGATSGVGECSVERASYRPQSKPSTGSAAASPFGPARGPRDRKQGAELSAEQWLRRGLEALDRGAPEAALEDFWEAIQGKPDDPQIPISAAVAALRHGCAEVAVEVASAAVRLAPEEAALYRVLGAAHYRLGEYGLAQEALQQALSLDSAHGLTYFLLGCTLEKLGQAEEAGRHFRRAAAMDPRYAPAGQPSRR